VARSSPRLLQSCYHLSRPAGEAGEESWYWNWPARPEPPATPIHAYRKPGFIAQAAFWANVQVDGKSVSSEKVVLKVKNSAGNGTK
jgi:hypothetical protein